MQRWAGFAMAAGGMGLIIAGIVAKRMLDASWILIPLHTIGFIGGLLPGLLLMTSREWDEETGV
jgi:hypothetical protein